ncbi:calcium-binding protein [Citreimonas sp.]|uniref:calcium-binding protein n=1 Tax=Citreimonas sp. TaxID=3036715 RepID=UPI004058418B
MIARIARGLALAGALLAGQAAQAERDAARTYFFGNSLVYQLAEEAPHRTSVPYWVGQLARAAGKDFAADGQWGFLRNFANDLPPRPNWAFPGVADAWPRHDTGLGAQQIDSVVVTPANFIQFQKPDAPYQGDDVSPLGAVLTVLDHVAADAPGARLYFYEGWADMGPVTGGYPPQQPGYGRYIEMNATAHPAWYDDLEAAIARARPGMGVTRIPTAQVLARLLGPGGLLEGIDPQALFADAAPHGTPGLYLLAGMVTYAALFDAPPPVGFPVPDDIPAPIRENYAAIAALVGEMRPAGAIPAQAEAAPLPPREAVALPPSGLRPDKAPALGMGLAGLDDWATQHPFLDLMKSARPWVAHTEARWGAVSTDVLRAGGHLDVDGWPLSIPEGATRLESVFLTDMPEDAEYLRGDYVMLYDGQAAFELTGRASRVRYEPGRVTFSYEPGAGVVGIAIDALPEADPIRNIRVVKAEMLPRYEAGEIFNPDWIARIADMRVLRFMDWMRTNGSTIARWEDRPRLSDATWTAWGVPVEVMLRLANLVGADPWFTLPHMADDDYVRRFAEAVRDGLDPALKAHVEYSNEVWNWIFPQAQWARAQAEALWGASGDGWMQYYGLRAAQVADIWAEVFGEEAADRLVRVVAVQTGWPGLEESVLTAPLAMLRLGRMPEESFDAYAVTGYFGYEMGGDEMAPVLRDWLDRSEAAARAAGVAQGLERVALREYVRDHRFDAAIAPMTQALRDGSLRELVDEILPYHAAVAEEAGLRLIMYEGGTHLAARDAQLDDARLTEFFEVYSYTPEMAALYETLLQGWVAAGGTLFTAFVDVAPPSRWGSWGALRHLGDANPRWDMLMAYNATAPVDWSDRDASVFAGEVDQAVDQTVAPLSAPASEP